MAAGPLTAALRKEGAAAVEKFARHLSPAVARINDIVVARGSGSYVWTTDGQKLLDVAGGIGTQSTGHSHPKVAKAIADQAGKIIHSQQNLFAASEPLVELLDRLNEICPPNLPRYLFANSGSEAVDNAIKIARAATGKQNIIAFEGGFHGRTYGAMAVTSSKVVYRQNFGPLMPQVFIAPYPYCLHCKVRQAAPSGKDWYKLEPYIPPFQSYDARRCCGGPHEALKWMLKQQTHPSETAAVIIEPILGEGGFLTPPPDFMQTVRKICDENNLLLIVQSGVGRTGKWWGHQHLPGADPDIMIFAKGIASGFPFAGVATRDDLYGKMTPGMLGGTYAANALGCAAASATIDVIKEEKLLDNATQRGQQLVQGLVSLAKRFPIIDIRGRGLMVAAEFGGSDGSVTPKSGVATAVSRACYSRGMLIMTAGARETLRFLPALNITAEQVDEALSIFEGALEDVFSKSAEARAASG
eukprot:jgi/Chlat1/7605/Chrsp64S00557